MTEIKTLAQYIISHKPLEVCCDHLEALVQEVINHKNYDQDDAVVSCIIGDAETLLGLAEDAQEAAEIEWEMAANNPDHPRHQEVWAELNASKPDPVKAGMESWVSQQDPATLTELNKSLNKLLKK
jgi:hypothetical protein